MSNDLSLSVRIYADAARYASGLLGAGSATRRFVDGARREFDRLKGAAGSLHGQLAMLGAGVSVAAVAAEAGRLEKEMRLLQVATGDNRAAMEGWRRDMLANQKTTGTLVSSQEELSGALQAAGLNVSQIRTILKPASETMAVAKTNGVALGKAMGVLGEQFKFDLTDPKAVSDLLDQMVVAGRLGNAEMENLPDIFAKVGSKVRDANLQFTESLALIETMSKVEPQADRLGTLVDSTLRVFSNPNYMKDAAKATKVKFFNADGSRREALDVIEDIKKRYDKLRTDKDRFKFIGAAFGKADLDTQKGMKQLLDSDQLKKLDEYRKQIEAARGTAKKDLSTATDNSPDQINRLKAALREAVDDGFSRPLNEAITKAIGQLMNPKAKGGWELSGTEMLTGGAAIAAGAYGITRIGGALLSKVGGTAAGVATGKALEAAAGVTPVFVVNMPNGGPGGGAIDGAAGGAAAGLAGKVASKWKVGAAMAGGLPLKDFLKLGVGAIGTAAAATTAAGAAGYGAGTLAYKAMEGTKAGDFLVDKVGGGIARVLALFGNEDAKRAVAMTEKLERAEIGGTIQIQVTAAPGVTATTTATPANSRTRLPVGPTMRGPN